MQEAAAVRDKKKKKKKIQSVMGILKIKPCECLLSVKLKLAHLVLGVIERIDLL